MEHIVVIGGGFAGLWSAAAAVRRAEELNAPIQVTLVNKDRFHSIRVRNYEDDLSETLVPLEEVLNPIGVELLIGTVNDIDVGCRSIQVDAKSGPISISYDKLILASGSKVARPSIPGVEEYTFDIDTFAAASRLQKHIDTLAARNVANAETVVVIGSGATGVELATELPQRLARALGGRSERVAPRIILADRQPHIAGGLGEGQEVIERACRDLGIELMTGLDAVGFDAGGVTLADGSRIETPTVVWCAGMVAEGLTASVPGDRDSRGRLFVDHNLRVTGVADVYAAGDTAHALIDNENPSVMSCQHARPMGRYAGMNAVNELMGEEMVPLYIDWYTNIVDLGPWGAVYTQGWDRHVVAEGAEAKVTKQVINRDRIYPPKEKTRSAILEAAAPYIQRPPILAPLTRKVA